jgi:p-aminobenzoyl-glutamate transporter AbgT
MKLADILPRKTDPKAGQKVRTAAEKAREIIEDEIPKKRKKKAEKKHKHHKRSKHTAPEAEEALKKAQLSESITLHVLYLFKSPTSSMISTEVTGFQKEGQT